MIVMKNKMFLLVGLICCIAVLPLAAQKTTGCGFKVPPRSLIKTRFQSVYEARDILKNMLDTIQWKQNFSIREQNGIRNAYATIINNIRWIIYDNDFLEDIDAYTSTKWGSISVLAHEMGHHYYNHVVSSSGSTPPKEIEADAFSGYVMAKLGASLQQSIAAIQAIASDRASSSHPAKKDRVEAITKGWNAAKGTVTNPTYPSSPNPTPPATPTTPPAPTYPTNPGNTGASTPDNDASWIGLTIQSNKGEVVLLRLRLKYYNGYRTFKLMHGKDYSILWNRRTKNWTVTEVPD
jgi:hypothetical protein